jgi:RNA polymerase sigma factor (sigma-70 family)
MESGDTIGLTMPLQDDDATAERAAGATDDARLVELMGAYQAGRIEAFERLYVALSEDVRRYFAVVLRDRATTADLVQETFLEMHRSRHTYTPPLPVRPWIFGIARHVRWRHRRLMQRRARHEDPRVDAGAIDVQDDRLSPSSAFTASPAFSSAPSSSSASPSPSPSPSSAAAAPSSSSAPASAAPASTRVARVPIDQRDVEDAILRLPPTRREVWLLHHVHGFSFQEIADRLRIGVGAAKLRSSRAMRTLRELLGAGGGGRHGHE